MCFCINDCDWLTTWPPYSIRQWRSSRISRKRRRLTFLHLKRVWASVKGNVKIQHSKGTGYKICRNQKLSVNAALNSSSSRWICRHRVLVWMAVTSQMLMACPTSTTEAVHKMSFEQWIIHLIMLSCKKSCLNRGTLVQCTLGNE
jgi:hypothetical protein